MALGLRGRNSEGVETRECFALKIQEVDHLGQKPPQRTLHESALWNFYDDTVLASGSWRCTT